MPLFDPDASTAIIAPAMYHLADRLSETTGWRVLANDLITAGTVDNARSKLVICHEEDPWDMASQKFSLEQLETGLLEGNIALAGQNPIDVTRPESQADAEARCSIVGATLDIGVRRQIPADVLATYGADDVYLRFLELIELTLEELREIAYLKKPIVNTIRLATPPLWNEEETVSAQGSHLWCFIEVDVGDRGGDES